MHFHFIISFAKLVSEDNSNEIQKEKEVRQLP